jgi:hypothetical protein
MVRRLPPRHTSVVKASPEWLPKATSKKWHNRLWWDSVGYLRVRTLSNPKWTRDIPWLQHVIESHRPAEAGVARDAIDEALRAIRWYRDPKEGASVEDLDARWDQVLDSIDRYLKVVQDQHIAAVEDAGASGIS